MAKGVTEAVKDLYNATVDELSNMRSLLYEFAACKVFDIDKFVRNLEKTKWELKDLGSDESAYMNRMVKELRYLNQKLGEARTPSAEQDALARGNAEQGAVVITPARAPPAAAGGLLGGLPVSYTPLTLPPICGV